MEAEAKGSMNRGQNRRREPKSEKARDWWHAGRTPDNGDLTIPEEALVSEVARHPLLSRVAFLSKPHWIPTDNTESNFSTAFMSFQDPEGGYIKDILSREHFLFGRRVYAYQVHEKVEIVNAEDAGNSEDTTTTAFPNASFAVTYLISPTLTLKLVQSVPRMVKLNLMGAPTPSVSTVEMPTTQMTYHAKHVPRPCIWRGNAEPRSVIGTRASLLRPGIESRPG
jgi:hypothetical protein